MDTIKAEESNFVLPPARDLLRSTSVEESMEKDNMVIDEPLLESQQKGTKKE
jgi:hypothetical protein